MLVIVIRVMPNKPFLFNRMWKYFFVSIIRYKNIIEYAIKLEIMQPISPQ